MLFWGSAKPSFGWYKVTKKSYDATTTKTRLPGAPKLGTSLIVMSSLGCQNLQNDTVVVAAAIGRICTYLYNPTVMLIASL